MIGIVQADRDEMPGVADARPEPGAIRHQRQRGRVNRAQAVERGIVHGRAGDVGDVARQVAQLALGIQQAGLFRALGAIANQFQDYSPIKK